MCQFGEISETTIPNEENSILLPVDSPVQAQATLENGKDSNIPNQPYGEQESECLSNPDHDSLLLSNLNEWSNEDLELFLPPYIWQDTLSRLDLFEHQTWVQDTSESDYLLFPTLTSGGKGSSRAAGQVKCERWWKEKGLIQVGSQLGTSAIAQIMGFPFNWFKVLGKEELSKKITPIAIALQEELEADTSQEEAAPQDKQQLYSGESSISIPSASSFPLEKSDEPTSSFPLEKKQRHKLASGTLYPYTAVREGKQGKKEYEYWAYSYETKIEGEWKSKKKSVPKYALQRISDAIAQRRGIEYVLEILGGKR